MDLFSMDYDKFVENQRSTFAFNKF